MRYKEFVTVETVDQFMNILMRGNNSIGSFAASVPDASAKSSDNKTDTTDTTTSNTLFSKDEELPVNAPITSPFGKRSSGMHFGTDFGVPIGTPVKAPQDGIVSRTGSDSMNGTFVEINSGGTIHSLLHLSQSKVTTGQQVKKGQVVGLSGNTGHSTGPHLHWSKRVAGRPVDPMANVG
jgi:murein DD-endopeptidase MepM/ murein hydrolase activator NlpD